MPLVFLDSWDHYTDIVSKWDFVGGDNAIRLNTGAARTGIGCLQINSGAFGPTKSTIPIADVLVGTAWYSDVEGNILSINILLDAPYGLFDSVVIILRARADGSLQIIRGPSAGQAVVATSAPGLITFNSYNSIALRSTIGAAALMRVYCNGSLVLSTVADNRNLIDLAQNETRSVSLFGPGGIPLCFHDDTYIFDCSAGPNSAFPGGAPRIYAATPFADGAPLAWTPLSAGTHYTEVDEIPPDDDTSYNSSDTVGQIDQYRYNPTGVPAGSQLLAVQHNLDMKVDSGARSVASVVESVVGTGQAISSDYHDYTTPYDINPATGLPWAAADFPVEFGPGVTA